MRFDDWWATLHPAEQKLIGVNNARFVWEEASKQAPNIMFIDGFTLSRSGDRMIIMADNGEGGSFSLVDFSEVVKKFFADTF